MRLLLDAYHSYLGGLAELRVSDPDELIAALEDWGPGREQTPWRPRRSPVPRTRSASLLVPAVDPDDPRPECCGESRWLPF